MSRALPRLGAEWGRCGTCGRGFPITHLVLSKRYGWQCLPGLWTIGCYDGPVQRDEIRYIPRSGEGTRRSTSPEYDSFLSSSGIDVEQTARVQYWTDQVNGKQYKLAFGTSITFVEDDRTDLKALGGLKVNFPFSVWISDGSMQFGSIAPMNVKSYGIVPSWIALYVEDGSLMYNAPAG